MPSLFNAFDVENIEKRIDQVNQSSQPLWGKMNAEQMLKHCNLAFDIPLGKTTLKRGLFLKAIASVFKSNFLNPEKPLQKNAPTAPQFVVNGTADLNVEKVFLKNNIDKFIEQKEHLGNREHGFVGKINSDEWATAMFKHLDHHLRQFGV